MGGAEIEFMSMLSLDGVFTYASPEGELIFGLSPAETVGHSIYEFVMNDDLVTVTQLHHNAAESMLDLASNRAHLRVRIASGFLTTATNV